MIDLSGRVIIVTGASSGIGQSVAFYASRAGARVALIGRDINRLRETYDSIQNESRIFSLDLSKDIDNISLTVERIRDTMGPIWGLVHAAGQAGAERPPPKHLRSGSSHDTMWLVSATCGVSPSAEALEILILGL